MNLFEINAQIMNCVDTETGEIVDIDKLMQLTLEKKNDKVDNVACYIKNLEADAKAYEEQEKSFAERKTAAKKKIEGLKRYLSEALDGKSFKSDRCEVKFRKSTAVNVLDESVVPVEYMTEKVTKTVNKTAIAGAIKSGTEVPGCTLEYRMNPTVK